MMAFARPLFRRRYAWSIVALATFLPFQNCGQQMKSSRTETASAQCKTELKAEAVKGVDPTLFSCGSFNNYKCDRRIFSPEVADMVHSLRECVSGEICVDVEVRQYGTAHARGAPADEPLFEPGGSYNREEVRCYHRYFYQGIAVFEGEGSSLEEALAVAMKACESAGETL